MKKTTCHAIKQNAITKTKGCTLVEKSRDSGGQMADELPKLSLPNKSL